MAFYRRENHFLAFSRLRHSCCDRINAIVPTKRAMAEVVDGFVRKASVENRKIDEPRHWAIRRGLPIVGPARSGKNNERLLTFLVLCLGRFDGAPRLQIDASGPT